MSKPERASAASVAKRRLSALSEQLVAPIPNQGTFEGIPKLKKVAGPSNGPRATGKVVIITGMPPRLSRCFEPHCLLARLSCPVLFSGGRPETGQPAAGLRLKTVVSLLSPPLTHPKQAPTVPSALAALPLTSLPKMVPGPFTCATLRAPILRPTSARSSHSTLPSRSTRANSMPRTPRA